MNGTLYLLKGTAVTGSANVASPKIPEEDMTKLWHMRLGHVGERENALAEFQTYPDSCELSFLCFCSSSWCCLA